MSISRRSSPFLVHTEVWGSRINAIHKAMPYQLRFDHHPPNFAFQQKSGSLHLSMPHYQSISYHWFLPIYNLWARMSQRRALSKRIYSPPPNRYIFSRDQRIQYKGIQCQTHHPFTSSFWVWTKQEVPSTLHIHRSPSTSGRPPTISILLGVQPNQDRQ